MTAATTQPRLRVDPPVHDLGGRAEELASTRVPYDPDEPIFHAGWERDVFGVLLPVLSAISSTPGEFRLALERLAPADYFDNGYYGRWLAGLELLAVEHGLVDGGQVSGGAVARATPSVGPRIDQLGPIEACDAAHVPHRSARRQFDAPPCFAVGDQVTITEAAHSGHTRRASYAVGAIGTVVEHHPPELLPDASAHRLAEHPCWVYAVRFDASALWGDEAEPNTTITIDAYEPYLRHAEQP